MSNESPFAHRIARTTKTRPPFETRPATIDTTPAEPAQVATAPAPVPVETPKAAPAPVVRESSGLRQLIVALIAFVVTTLVLLLAVVIWKSILSK